MNQESFREIEAFIKFYGTLKVSENFAIKCLKDRLPVDNHCWLMIMPKLSCLSHNVFIDFISRVYKAQHSFYYFTSIHFFLGRENHFLNTENIFSSFHTHKLMRLGHALVLKDDDDDEKNMARVKEEEESRRKISTPHREGILLSTLLCCADFV